ncbi:MAG: LamG domain-containing protein, partial [Azoarcus sp.]|nr:LamG domain-containing protein [Azoarcus sp.]
RWYHIAVTRQDGVFRMFVDGQLEASATKSIAVDFSQNGTAIGNNGWDADGFFIGYIDELRVTKGRARYTSAFTPPNAPFVFASGT